MQESAEMYLETILVLSHKIQYVRSIDIAGELDYKKSSVSVAMKNLRENGYIDINVEGYITLTEKGKEIAETIYERHTFIANWLIQLGVDKVTAAEDACRMEHVISTDSFNAIKKHAKGSKIVDIPQKLKQIKTAVFTENVVYATVFLKYFYNFFYNYFTKA